MAFSLSESMTSSSSESATDDGWVPAVEFSSRLEIEGAEGKTLVFFFAGAVGAATVWLGAMRGVANDNLDEKTMDLNLSGPHSPRPSS